MPVQFKFLNDPAPLGVSGAALAALSLAAAFIPATAKAQFVCAGSTAAGGGSATAVGSVSCGDNAVASGVNSSAAGQKAQATGDSSTADGLNSQATGLESTAIGFNSLADGRGGNALGGRNHASATFSTAVGWANTASGLDSFAAGNKSVASGVSSVALGDAAQASGDLGIALGARASAPAANSVALGADSVATQANTVSVGSATAQRRITNVARGTAASDAATFGQLQDGLGGLDGRIDLLGASVDAGFESITRRADSGAAVAMALAGLPQAFTPGKGMIGLAVGDWRGEQALAFGASKVVGQDLVFKAGASFARHGSGGANAGVGWQF